ncbi:MAG: N-acetylglucosamine-6-phosphate deacetylase [Microcoleaceae cyanobacterium]
MTNTTIQTSSHPICVDLINVRIPGYDGLQHLQIRNSCVSEIQPISATDNKQPAIEQIDLNGDWISLGGIDLQINGAKGLAFPDLTPTDTSKLQKICHYLWQQGIDGFLPTIVTTTVENIQRSLSTIAQYCSQVQNASKNTAQILGVHLEGPFLNPVKRGAHPKDCLLPLTLENVKQVLGEYASIVKVMTLAPELDQTGEVIAYLRQLGITVSLGHSLATATQAQHAFNQGATMVTHAFNAMPGLHHREPGLLGAALTHPQVYCGLIADGQHVCPTMAEIILKASPTNIFLVSDALSPLGLADGVYPWDQREIEVKLGTARLLDGTLSGTTLPLLTGVQNLVQWGICSIDQAIAIATDIPRTAIGLPGIVGQSATQLLYWQLETGSTSERSQLSWTRLFETSSLK